MSLLLGQQPPVLERDPGRCTYRREQLTFVLQRRVMEKRRHPRPLTIDQRHRSAARRFRQDNTPPIQICPTAELRQPVRQLERRITESARKRIAKGHRGGIAPQLDEQISYS